VNLKNINAEISFDGLWVELAIENEKIDIGIGQIKPCNTKGEYHLIINNNLRNVILRDPSIRSDLDFHLKRGCAHLAEVVQTTKDGSALLQVVFFNGDIVEMGSVEVGIDERIEETAKRNGIHFSGAANLGAHLAEKCKIMVGSETFFVMMCGPAADIDFEVEDADSSSQDSQNINTSKQYREFSLCGERLRIPVEKRNIEKFKEIFFATKVVFKDNQSKEGALRLARGQVIFLDYTKTGGIRALAAGALRQLTQETGSYLKQWDKYGAIEGEMLLSRARSVGWIDYHGVEKTAKGVKFFIPSNLPDHLSVGDEMEITSKEPLYLRKPDIDWEQYSHLMEEEFKSKVGFKPSIDKDINESVFAPIIGITNTSIELALPSKPSETMCLILSINGDKIQIERRMKARSAIIEGRSANPLLGLLIEEGGVLPNLQRVTKIKPLTPFVKDKIFKNPPTDMQVDAIDIALNTPDIALIQGPPGTGKTTVITAILERLNEEYDKTRSIRGQILVSGFQHDAVENIVSRLSVNALPAVKFGKRASDSEFREDALTQRLNIWCRGIVENIREKNPQISQTEDQVRLGELFVEYSLCPSNKNIHNLLDRILELPRDVLQDGLVAQANDLLTSIRSEMTTSDPFVVRLIRSLRISEKGFLDDGSERATDLIEEIGCGLNPEDIELLEKSSRWRQGNELDFIDELKALKEKLLLMYLPRPEFKTEKPREDVLDLVAKVSKQLQKSLGSKNKRDAILAEFLHELEDNPDGVRESVEDYNFIFAATTQQAAGAAIRRAKTKFKDDSVKYDTVIIDEAARTSPRDLLIPMSQAEKRIILVGDHRQLPHIIDEDVVKIIEGNSGDSQKSESDYVRESMFAYLFKRLKKLEEKDGITRTVTLDAQYRTHPVLGKFVSDNFYMKHGEGYRSPLSEEYFNHSLPGIQRKAAVWIDVANSEGDEGKVGFSRKRTIEAKVIAEKLASWINSKEGKYLSFGVISFYKAQAFEVYKELEGYNITEKSQDGAWQIGEDYQFLGNGEERLRIGTVDAFQGMEFDIVFLSIVRTQKPKKIVGRSNPNTDYEKLKHRTFGHLMSENRLCVSMSRQKKVLTVVGDGSLIQSQIAIDAVPALKNFYDLCNEQGTIL